MRAETTGIDREDSDRSAGFLTQTEREYLLDEWTPNDGTGYDESQAERKESEIKTRTRHALADFALLQERGSEDLKQEVILSNADPPVFLGEMKEYLVQGMLRFASDAAMDEEFTGFFFDDIDLEEFSSDVEEGEMKNLLQLAARGRNVLFMKRIFSEFAEVGEQAGVSKDEAMKALDEVWPE